MPNYRVFVEGKSFEREYEGRTVLMGFATTRFVTADNIAHAHALAIDAVSARPDLRAELDRPGSLAIVLVGESDLWNEPLPMVQPGLAWFPVD